MMPGRRPACALLACALLACAAVLAGCSSGLGQAAGAAGTPPPASAPSVSSPSAHATDPGADPSPPQVPGITWRPEGTTVHGRPVTYVAGTDAGAIGLLWIDPASVTFRLVPGTTVPEGGPSTAADNRPATWVPRLVAAFNGGFRLGDHVGGYYDLGRTVAPLVRGMGSLAIDAGGRLQVGRWGRDLALTPGTVVVRQNLPLLVDQGRPMTATTDTARTWGLANGGLWTANRSALGVRPDGTFVYAYGHEVRPAAMAAALVAVGVQRAIVLDMNKSWPGGFVYWRTATGIHGLRIQAQEYHAPGVYYRRFTKDFVAVLLR